MYCDKLCHAETLPQGNAKRILIAMILALMFVCSFGATAYAQSLSMDGTFSFLGYLF